MAYCSACGFKNEPDAVFCEECGTRLAVTAAPPPAPAPRQAEESVPRAPRTERTESTVMQVAPDYENDMIKEMDLFGWSLQGRQEIHEEGDAYGRSGHLDELFGESTYVIETKVSRYVKLHFVRSRALPNLDRIREIEAEYFALPFPILPAPKSYLWPALFLFMGITGLTVVGQQDIVTGLGIMGIGAVWLFAKIMKRQKSLRVCEESVRRRRELLRELKPLLE